MNKDILFILLCVNVNIVPDNLEFSINSDGEPTLSSIDRPYYHDLDLFLGGYTEEAYFQHKSLCLQKFKDFASKYPKTVNLCKILSRKFEINKFIINTYYSYTYKKGTLDLPMSIIEQIEKGDKDIINLIIQALLSEYQSNSIQDQRCIAENKNNELREENEKLAKRVEKSDFVNKTILISTGFLAATGLLVALVKNTSF